MNWIAHGAAYGGAVVWWWPIAAAVLGLVAGQAANMAASYLPSDEPFCWPLAPCPACGGRGRASDALSIVGWFRRRGQCARCRARLPVLAPAVELCNAALWAMLVFQQGPSIRTALLMLFVTALIALIVIDYHHYLLPDAITLPGIVAGVAACWIPGWPVSLLDSALSAGVGYFAMMALAKAAEMYYGEEALGQGDWKMVAMLGAFLGATRAMATVLVANGAGALFGLLLVATLGEKGRQKLPLGTFLGAAGIAVVFW